MRRIAKRWDLPKTPTTTKMHAQTAANMVAASGNTTTVVIVLTFCKYTIKKKPKEAY